jgi:hypothetical protein
MVIYLALGIDHKPLSLPRNEKICHIMEQKSFVRFY